METAEYRREAMRLLDYDPVTGAFTWKVRQGRQAPGKPAGTPRLPEGHIQIRVLGAIQRAHRLAWLFMTGDWPPDGMIVDHKDRVPANNRWDNLRLATPTESSINRGLHSNNTSGHRGVYLHKHSGLWQALVFQAGKSVCLGYFKTKEAAAEARRAAAAQQYGAFCADPPPTS